MRSPRALIVALAVVLAALLVLTGGVEAALFALPCGALAALLLNGRYVGEERILALHRTLRPFARRAAASRWRRPRPPRAAGLFARAPRTLRGPPAPVLI
jgi:hypothetical protein